MAAAVCIGIALLAELSGISLVIRNGLAARRALSEWRRPTAAPDADRLAAVFRRRNTQLAHLQLEEDESVLEHVLASQARWGAAVVLLITGAVFGALGDILSLS